VVEGCGVWAISRLTHSTRTEENDTRTATSALLDPVYGRFIVGFSTRDLREAKALLEELAA